MTAFHLSLPVADFEATRFFYCDILKGKQEKTNPDWFNINLRGHQLTFHILPQEIITSKNLHWGLILPWDELHELFDRLQQQQVIFKTLPDYQDKGSVSERVKMVFADPSGYLIEFKAYKQSESRF